MGIAFRLNRKALGEIENYVSNKLELAAELVVSEAKQRCPVDTGNLRNSIEWGRVRDGVIVGSAVEYSVYQELGFIHWRSGRFIQNAFLLPGLMAALNRISGSLR